MSSVFVFEKIKLIKKLYEYDYSFCQHMNIKNNPKYLSIHNWHGKRYQ